MFYHKFVTKTLGFAYVITSILALVSFLSPYRPSAKASGQYGSLGMIPGTIWKMSCYNLYLLQILYSCTFLHGQFCRNSRLVICHRGKYRYKPSKIHILPSTLNSGNISLKNYLYGIQNFVLFNIFAWSILSEVKVGYLPSGQISISKCFF